MPNSATSNSATATPHCRTMPRARFPSGCRSCTSDYIACSSQKDRGSLYALDLRDVEIMIAQEQAGQAETLLDRAEDPDVRLRIAQQALSQLDAARGDGATGIDELPGRLQRLIEHWKLRLSKARRELDRRVTDQRTRKQRHMLYAASAVVLLVLAIPMRTSHCAAAGQRQGPGPELTAAAAALPDELRREAEQVLWIAAAVTTRAGQDPTGWLDDLEAAQQALLTAMRDSPARDAAAIVSARAWHEALQVAQGLAPWQQDEGRLLAAAQAATARLHVLGMQERN